MPRTVIAVNSLQSNLPLFQFNRPHNWWSFSSFAMLGDIIIAEKDATIGFAGAGYWETIKENSQNFQKSEYLIEKE